MVLDLFDARKRFFLSRRFFFHVSNHILILFSWVKSYFDAFLGAGPVPVPGHKILKFAPRAQISKFCFFLPGRCRCRDPRSHANFAVNRVFERYFEVFKLREYHSHLWHDLLYLLNLSDHKKVHSE